MPALVCFDEDEFILNGNTDSFNSTALIVEYHRCDATKRTSCKNDEEFKTWVKSKFIVVLQNT